MFFIILTTAITLNRHGITKIETSRQAAEALRPLAGNFRRDPIHPGDCRRRISRHPHAGWIGRIRFAETLGWRQGLNKKLRQARWFYALILVSNRSGRRTGLIAQSREGALLDSGHQWIAGAFLSWQF